MPCNAMLLYLALATAVSQAKSYEMFASDVTGLLYARDRGSGGSWDTAAAWDQLQGTGLTSLVPTIDGSGAAALFVLDAFSAINVMALPSNAVVQTSTFPNVYTAYTRLGSNNRVTQIESLTDRQGNLQVFGVNIDRSNTGLYLAQANHQWPSNTGFLSSLGATPAIGTLTDIAVVGNSLGGTTVFAVDTTGALLRAYQSWAGSAWTGWDGVKDAPQLLHFGTRSIAAATNSDLGETCVAGVSAVDKNVWAMISSTPTADTPQWIPIGPLNNGEIPLQISAKYNSIGVCEVFALTGSGKIIHSTHSSTGENTFRAWTQITGDQTPVANFTVSANPVTGVLEIACISKSDGTVLTTAYDPTTQVWTSLAAFPANPNNLKFMNVALVPRQGFQAAVSAPGNGGVVGGGAAQSAAAPQSINPPGDATQSAAPPQLTLPPMKPIWVVPSRAGGAGNNIGTKAGSVTTSGLGQHTNSTGNVADARQADAAPLSKGVIAAVVIVVLFAVVGIVAGLFFYLRRRQKVKGKDIDGLHNVNAPYYRSADATTYRAPEMAPHYPATETSSLIFGAGIPPYHPGAQMAETSESSEFSESEHTMTDATVTTQASVKRPPSALIAPGSGAAEPPSYDHATSSANNDMVISATAMSSAKKEKRSAMRR